METPANAFLYLSGLLEIVYGSISGSTCAQLKDDTKPCLNKIAKANLESLKESFGDLFTILNDPDRNFHDKDGAFNTVLEQLINASLCRQRHHRNSDGAKSQWLKELYNDEKRDLLRYRLQIYLLEPLEEESIISISVPPPGTEFELFQPESRSSGKPNVPLLVTAELLKPLGETDRKSGYIYLISHPREPKMFKIGFSTELERRFDEHRRCYEKFSKVASDFIPYVRRIEQLIIIEFSLKHYRLKEKCTSCHKTHKEWLQVNKATLLKSFNKWVQFAKALESPYDKEGNFKTKTVALPPPAMNFKSRSPTPTKKGSRRRSDIAPSQESTPSKAAPVKSDIRIIDEEISESNSDDPDYSGRADQSRLVSSISLDLAAIHI
ncbi:hypothetical protein N7517_002998 [Penicillium concentricum]|uniref:Bacteriophage T5 Orf172 DNA-binding domain-containing protein n=1 Tax=Penicillium concentricum TaxID=293559 RepID=A0A9W9SVE2_9EURO|nr:uncharacterized protein N7517_002998 [Penicillium concentricum]KAJ5385087.1 hypothetical protein N7517_002998 [Penicillium concentricum]